MIAPRVPLKVWLVLGILAIFLSVFTAYKWQERRADRAESRLAPVEASAKALDRVATEAPKIREDQKEKQREVDSIEGADQRLPDGFGDSLQRVRDKSRH